MDWQVNLCGAVECSISFVTKWQKRAALTALLTGTLVAQIPTPVPVLTWRYDITHAGANQKETALTPADVNVNSFGKLFSLPVDSTVYAQPLYVPGLKMSDGLAHNVLLVATENDSVYAFDADSGSRIWQISLLTAAHGAASGATPVPWQDTGSPDVAPAVGITGTPVIDPNTNTVYLVANTKENGSYYSRLHAINIVTGAEQAHSPVDITASVPGTGNGSSGGQVAFSPLWENQRPALALYNGYVYIGFAAHGDNGPWHGWLFAYNAATLTQSDALNLSPNTFGAGIWGAGAGLPIDDDASGGRMFVSLGNGDVSNYPEFSSTSSLGESVVQFNLAGGKLTPEDAFTPCDYQTLNDHDLDLGGGGVLMLPDQQGANPHILIAGGKEGRIYVLNRDNLGGYPASQCDTTPPGTDSTALQELTGITPEGEGFWNTPAYWNGNVYVWPENGSPMLFHLNNGVMNTTPSSTGSGVTSAFPSPSFSISSDGTQDGIAWAVRSDQFNTGGPGVLYAWNADDLSTPIYESDTDSSRDAGSPANRYSIPVVTNGKVYVAANGEVDVYGLLNDATEAAAPQITPDGGTFAATQSVTLSTATTSASIYYTLDGSTPTTSSPLYTGPITISSQTTLQAIAAAAGYTQSPVSSATFLFSDQTPAATFSPAAGTYQTAQSVSLADADGNAKIYYTTDGSTPSSSSTLYSGPISVESSETINAIAIDPSLRNSIVVSSPYVIQSGGATINFSNGFSSTAGLTLNGSALAVDDTRLQLTDGGLNEAGSVFWSAPIGVQAFTTTFQFQLSSAQANGFTFTIQNMGPRALGRNSAGLGYQDIQQSVAVKFNFYDYQNEGSDSTGFYTNGEQPTTPTIDISPSGIQLNSGDSIQAQITYDGTTLTLNLHDLVTGNTYTTSTKIDIPQVVGGASAYVGFTGGTGGLSASQKILTWTYTAQGTGTNPAAGFSLTSSSIPDINVGSSGTSQITVTPNGGFTGAVTLGCAVTSASTGNVNPPACSVTQPQPITGANAVTATLTITTTIAPSTAHNGSAGRLVGYGGSILAAVALLCVPRRRKWQAFFALIFVAIAGVASGCGGSYKVTNPSSKNSNTGTTPGAYSVTITGTANGSMTQSTQVSVTVK